MHVAGVGSMNLFSSLHMCSLAHSFYCPVHLLPWQHATLKRPIDGNLWCAGPMRDSTNSPSTDSLYLYLYPDLNQNLTMIICVWIWQSSCICIWTWTWICISVQVWAYMTCSLNSECLLGFNPAMSIGSRLLQKSVDLNLDLDLHLDIESGTVECSSWSRSDSTFSIGQLPYFGKLVALMQALFKAHSKILRIVKSSFQLRAKAIDRAICAVGDKLSWSDSKRFTWLGRCGWFGSNISISFSEFCSLSSLPSRLSFVGTALCHLSVTGSLKLPIVGYALLLSSYSVPEMWDVLLCSLLFCFAESSHEEGSPVIRKWIRA